MSDTPTTPQPGRPSPPPGWHPDPRQPGQQRYWDGHQWTGQQRPMAPGPGATAVVGPAKKSGVGKGCLIAGGAGLLLLILIGIVGALAGSPDDEKVSTAETPTTEASTTTEATTTTEGATTTERPTTTAPPTTTKPTTTPPPPSKEEVVQSGQGAAKTPPFKLKGGSYTVHYKFDGECFYGGTLDSTGGGFDYNEVGTGQGPVEGDTNLYNISGGEYFINMITGPAPSCAWTVTIREQ